uniref:Uncharacterized protein n=1 Tax=Oryza glumipatula TaxID=40148 RepID=A0A0E0ACD6_9ORYZ
MAATVAAASSRKRGFTDILDDPCPYRCATWRSVAGARRRPPPRLIRSQPDLPHREVLQIKNYGNAY